MRVTRSFNFGEIQGYKFGYAPFGEPDLFVHIYYIDGLLIDSGQAKMRKAILHTLRDLPVQQIVITHHHEDHSGNIAPLKDHFQCPVYTSELCSQIMKEPPPISLAQKIYWGDRPAYQGFEIVKDILKTDKYSFRIIPIPGHAADMFALYEPGQGWLFAADLYVNSYIAYFLREESVWQQIQSIKSILKLDFDVLLCAHNPKMEGGKKKLEKKLFFLENFYDQVASLHRQGNSAEAIFKKLKLKENWFVKMMSGGALSKMNMVRAVIRDVQ